MGARFSTLVQTGPGAYPASCTMGTGSFPGVKRPGRGADHPPPSKRRGHERVELYLYSTSGSSWRVLGRTLHLPLWTEMIWFRLVILPGYYEQDNCLSGVANHGESPAWLRNDSALLSQAAKRRGLIPTVTGALGPRWLLVS